MAEVAISVKNVYSGGQARDLRVPRAATVRELKRLVAREMPERPPPAAQKLIFGGKICADADVLDDLLAQQGHAAGQSDDAPVVFHLLVAKAPGQAVAASATEAEAPSPPAEAAGDSPRPSTEAAPTPSVFAQPPAAVPAPPAATAPAFMSFPSAQAAAQPHHDVYRQMALMQQQAMILTQIQYLQQLQQQAQGSGQAAAPAPGVQAFGAPFYQPYMPFGNFYGAHMGHFAHHMPPNAAAGTGAHAVPNPAAAAGAAAAAAPVAAPAAPRGPPPMVVAMVREVLPLFEIRLALKMAFMLFLIGQDTPTDRILMLGLLSFISYLHITGIFAKIYEVYQRHRRPEAAGNGDNQQEGTQGVPGAAAQPAGAAGRIGNAASLISRLLRISSDRGMVQDIKYFCVGLLLSLVPAWHPQPLAGGAAPAMPPAENAMPEGAEIPLQGI